MEDTLSKSSEEGASGSLEQHSSFSSPSSGGIWKILAIIAIVSLVTIGGFYAYGFYSDYQQGKLIQSYNQGQLDYVMQQTQSGEVFYATNQSGNWTLAKTTFAEICGGEQ